MIVMRPTEAFSQGEIGGSTQVLPLPGYWLKETGGLS